MNVTVRLSPPGNPQLPSGPSLLSQIWLVSISLLALFNAGAKAQQTIILVGSGSTVPAPLFSRWIVEYDKRNPLVQMRYLPLGTSAGILEISHGNGDFAAGEVLLTGKERADGALTELPAAIIAIVPIYNLPGLGKDLRLSGDVLASIFLGDLKMWNAPQISQLNPGITLPNISIHVINRPGGKGSNYVFTDFLSKENSKFRAQIGTTASPHWPIGTMAERSSDMVDKVRSEFGAVGYVEVRYAARDNISQVAVLNPAGKFVKASRESIAAACPMAGVKRWKSFSVSLVNATGADSFPITRFSWIYVPTHLDSSRAAALVNFVDWVYSDGQQFASQEGYVPLPPQLIAAVRRRVEAF